MYRQSDNQSYLGEMTYALATSITITNWLHNSSQDTSE